MGRRQFLLISSLVLLAALLSAACFNDAVGPDAPAEPPTASNPSATAPPAQGGQPNSGQPQGTGAGLADNSTADPQTDANAAPPADTTTPSTQTDPQSDPPTAPEAPPVPPLQAVLFVQPAIVTPGQVFLVAVDTVNATAASVALDGQFVSLAREGDRFYAILPVPFETKPGILPLIIAVADLNGALALQQLVQIEVQAGDFLVESVTIDTTLARLFDPEVVEEDRALRAAVQSVRTPLRMWQGYFRLPAEGVISSTFGLLRSYNGAEPTDFHSGLDFAGPLGTDILAANAGIVAWTGETERRGRGVIIDHGQGVFSSYWHMANVATAPGTTVAAGAVIGRVGNTGLSTGPHLHWELTVFGVPVDPLPWLRELEVPDPLAVFDPLQAVNQPAQAGGG